MSQSRRIPLTGRQKLILSMHLYDGLSHAEIAERFPSRARPQDVLRTIRMAVARLRRLGFNVPDRPTKPRPVPCGQLSCAAATTY